MRWRRTERPRERRRSSSSRSSRRSSPRSSRDPARGRRRAGCLDLRRRHHRTHRARAGARRMRVIRAMTNTPATIEDCVALAPGAHAHEKDMETAVAIFEEIGCVAVVDEVHLDAITGLCGSGPAYVFLIVEAFADAASSLGCRGRLQPSLRCRRSKARLGCCNTQRSTRASSRIRWRRRWNRDRGVAHARRENADDDHERGGGGDPAIARAGRGALMARAQRASPLRPRGNLPRRLSAEPADHRHRRARRSDCDRRSAAAVRQVESRR